MASSSPTIQVIWSIANKIFQQNLEDITESDGKIQVLALPHQNLFVAIDLAGRWISYRTYKDQSEISSVDFLRRVKQAAPMKIGKILTDRSLRTIAQSGCIGYNRSF